MNIEIRFWTRTKLMCYDVIRLVYTYEDDMVTVEYKKTFNEEHHITEHFEVKDIASIDFDTIPF